MKLKRFNTLHEAAKSKKELEKEAMDFIIDELKKKKMSRYDMVNAIEKKFKDEKDSDKIARKTADDIIHDPGKKKNNVKSDSFKGGVKADSKTYYPYFFIGDEAKDPTGLTKKEDKKKDKKDKKEDKGKKVDRFDDFKKKDKKEDKEPEIDEKEAKAAKADAEKDMKEDKKSGKTDRQTEFTRDSLDQLYQKRGDKKYKEFWDDIEDEIAERPRKKGRK